MNERKSLYLNKAQLKAEMDRCLNCKNSPCMTACPVNCNPQEFINHAKQGNFDSAVETIARNNPMGQTCGLICPDKFCMQACTRSRIDFSVNIPKVQATILENYRTFAEAENKIKPNGEAVAIIGAGPAGIAAASALAKYGYKVTIFEASNKIGGALNMIPEERLPHSVIEKDWQHLCKCDLVDLRLNTKIADPRKFLTQDYSAVIIAAGEPYCTNLNIEGEEHCLSYMEYLQNPHKYQTSGRVAVVGGGCVAADCALTAAANGASHVEMFVRRRLSDMRITRAEYLDLLDRDVNITALTSPEKAELHNGLVSLYIRKNRFADGKLVPMPNSTIEIPDFDLVVKAIGSFADPKFEHERIIYAGDCKHGGSTIVEAIASGQSAAQIINEKLLLAA